MAAPTDAAPLPGHWSRLRDCTFSECCDICHASSDTMEDALRRQHDAAGGIAESRRRMICAIAGDIKGIETLGGHAGASGKFNCMMCDCVLNETYVAGVPHLRVLPEPWKSADKRPPHIINPPARGGTAQMAEHAKLYAADSAACAPKELSSGLDKYKSCVHAPLFHSNDLAEHVTCTPLHVSLGKGTNYMKAVEHHVAQLDMAWALNVSDDAAIAAWTAAQAAVFVAKEEQEACEESIRSEQAGMAIILSKDPKASRVGRVDGARYDQRDSWVIRYRECAAKVKELNAKLVAAKAKVARSEAAEISAKDVILKLTPEGAGPFGEAFKALLAKLKISMKK